ncbi:MAG: hypothetical protein K8S27_08970 [Candidatus Omnitrophica bacterium]|nr:hypothetical protein [Candidatus Omnitrophota bacterium]
MRLRRREVNTMTQEGILKFVQALSVVTVVAGGYGMILCVPYIMHYNVHIISAASLPFIAGAVLVGSGLTAFAILVDKVEFKRSTKK